MISLPMFFQEVFTTLFQKLDGIDQPKGACVVSSRRAAQNLALHMKQKESVSADDDGPIEQEFLRLPDQSPLADEVVLKIEEQHRVRTAVALWMSAAVSLLQCFLSIRSASLC